MYKQRLHLLFPDIAQAEAAVSELLFAGLHRHNIHAIAREGTSLGDLPVANVRQRSDWTARIESVLRDLDLLLFFSALFVTLLAWSIGNSIWVGTGIMIMLSCVVLSFYVSSHVPHTHLEQHRAAIQHGKILVLVDVPKWRVHSLEKRLQAHHPEMKSDGVSWTLDGLGI